MDEKTIVNSHFGLCAECNELRLHPHGKRKYVIEKKPVEWKPRKRIAGRSKREKLDKSEQRFSGQLEMFYYIWGIKEHVSEVSGERLDAEPETDEWYWYFSHLLPKGKYILTKLDPDNIVLKTQHEHWLWHNLPRTELEKLPKWKPIFIRYDKAKLDYNRRFGLAEVHPD